VHPNVRVPHKTKNAYQQCVRVVSGEGGIHFALRAMLAYASTVYLTVIFDFVKDYSSVRTLRVRMLSTSTGAE
jgi:hypothetical protein